MRPLGDAATCPEDRVGVGAAGGGDGFVLQVYLEPLGHLLDSLDDFRVIAVAVGDGGAFADLDVAVLAFVDGGIVGRVGDVHHQRDVRVQ